jgi:2-polyprenyl-6-methoxyphenol hydroxylase-like FAD-dependent oxidoreductase
MILYTCNLRSMGPSWHPCGLACKALDEAGLEYEIRTVAGYTSMPWTWPFRRRDRALVRKLSGRNGVPILVLDDGEVIAGSASIREWAAGQRAMGTQRVGEHAVVIGASVAGLLAARALSDAYDRVTILERDELPAIGENRKAVPQGNHAHVMLASGQRSIEELLPGITDELFAAGAQSCESLREIRFVIAGHELTREASGADVLLASRPLIEGHVRRRVLALANVTVRERCDAVDLLTSQDNERVTGVRVRGRHGESGEEPLNADLVVAASGRAARVPALLEALGYPRPSENRLAVDLMYVSRRVRLQPGALGDDKLVLIGARPGLPRGVMLIAQEDHWILTVSGYGAEHHPPTDEDGYLEFIGTVAPADVVAAIRQSEPLSDFATHGFSANQRRRYEHLKRFPQGLLVVGDAISSFNPLYGQGMSVAALEAIELRRCLERGEQRLAKRFFRAAGTVVGHAWDMAVGGDLALPEVAGHRSMLLRISNAYVERLLRVAEHDPIVAAAFGDVGDLLAPPQEVMRPRILWRVLRGNRRKDGEPHPVTGHSTPSRGWP